MVAVTAGRVLVTCNAHDFILLHRRWPAWTQAWKVSHVVRHAGIMLIYAHQGIDAGMLAEVVDGFAEQHQDPTGRLVAWSATDDWHDVD